MDLGLAERVFILTGASRGLGFATAQALVADGARVVISSRDADRATLARLTCVMDRASLISNPASCCAAGSDNSASTPRLSFCNVNSSLNLC